MKENSNSGFDIRLLLSGFVVCVGALLLIAGLAISGSQSEMQKVCKERTTGTVVELVKHDTVGIEIGLDGDRGPTYHPMVRYMVGGNTYNKESKVGTNPPSYEVGDTVTVRYNPDDPSKFILGDSDVGLLAARIVAVAGGVTCGLGLLFVARSRKRK